MYLLQVIIYICIYYRLLYIYVSTTGHYTYMYLLQVIIYLCIYYRSLYIYMYLLQVIIYICIYYRSLYIYMYLLQVIIYICIYYRSLYYMLFSYQTGYIMWHSRLMIYIPWGAAEGNIEHKPGMSHYIPCLIAE
jgi:hypothetical protein